ncbi:hypothetical protein A2U01_0005216 [Trifolium medium]|uniref:Uncharacterized protein n=1 Tax=Trifolium medium TaxID=97028 RepID=A0A392MDM2_9FABA|nr:hypothetical protein [Trifolium medium]
MRASFDDYKNKHTLQQDLIKTLEMTEAKLGDVVKERDALLERVKELEGKIHSLEEKLKYAEVVRSPTEEEKEADPVGMYTKSSRAELITKIFEEESTMLEAANSLVP